MANPAGPAPVWLIEAGVYGSEVNPLAAGRTLHVRRVRNRRGASPGGTEQLQLLVAVRLRLCPGRRSRLPAGVRPAGAGTLPPGVTAHSLGTNRHVPTRP